MQTDQGGTCNLQYLVGIIDDTTVCINTGGTRVVNTVTMAELSVFLVALTRRRLE